MYTHTYISYTYGCVYICVYAFILLSYRLSICHTHICVIMCTSIIIITTITFIIIMSISIIALIRYCKCYALLYLLDSGPCDVIVVYRVLSLLCLSYDHRCYVVCIDHLCVRMFAHVTFTLRVGVTALC